MLHFVCESREPRAGARRGGVSVPHRIPHSPPHARFPNPFALSLSKGLSCRRHSCEGRPSSHQRGSRRHRPPIACAPFPGRRGGSQNPPAREPVEGPHPDTNPSRQRIPPHPPSPFPRKRESMAGARRGGVSVSRRSSTIPRHSREGRNLEGRGTPTTNPRLYSDSPNPREPHPSATSSTCRPAHPHRYTGGSRYPEGRGAPTSYPVASPTPPTPEGRFAVSFALSLSKPVLRAHDGGALSPHTLIPTPRANADAPVTLPPWRRDQGA